MLTSIVRLVALRIQEFLQIIRCPMAESRQWGPFAYSDTIRFRSATNVSGFLSSAGRRADETASDLINSPLSDKLLHSGTYFKTRG